MTITSPDFTCRSMPSSRMRPSSGSYSRASSFTSVVLPAPFSPTRASTSPARSSKSRWRTAQLSASGYWKPTFSNTKPWVIGCGTGTASGREWISGWIWKNENRSSRYSAWLATCEKPISRPSSSWRRRRKLPARKVRSPMEKSPRTVRQAM
ncbi:hypothetical protein D9M71_564750 [compost metagenome]